MSSLFINVSESEGFQVSIKEALSCGLLIIATNVGGISEIVDAHVGILIDKYFVFNDVSHVIIGSATLKWHLKNGKIFAMKRKTSLNFIYS